MPTKNPNYCSCNEFEKAVDYNDTRYYRPEDARFNAVKKAGWYIYSMGYERPVASLEPFKYRPWCSKKLAKPWNLIILVRIT
ncbi:MAG TPA: hypothetical protein VH500_13205 [Nitrososphaeraceae archaeon]